MRSAEPGLGCVRPASVCAAASLAAASGRCRIRAGAAGDEPAADVGDAGERCAARSPATRARRRALLDWAIPIGSQPSPAAAGSTTVKAVVATDDGGAIVAGSFTGSIAFAPDTSSTARASSGFVARYRRDQRLVWVHVVRRRRRTVVVADMASLGSDEVVVAGWFDGTLVVSSSDDSLIARRRARAGWTRSSCDSRATAACAGSKRAGGPGDDIARGVAASADASGRDVDRAHGRDRRRRRVRAGEAAETRAPRRRGPVFAARLDGDGALVWARFAGGGVPGQGYGVAHDAAGAVAVTGYVNGVAAFGNDVNGAPVSIDPAIGRAFVARWDVAGRLLWALPIGGPAGEGDAIAVAADGAIVAAGLFQGQARFGADAAAPTLLADSPGTRGLLSRGVHARRRDDVGAPVRRHRRPSVAPARRARRRSAGGGFVRRRCRRWIQTARRP